MKNFLKFSIFPSVKYLDEKYQNDQKQSKAKSIFSKVKKSRSKAKQTTFSEVPKIGQKQSKLEQDGNPG